MTKLHTTRSLSAATQRLEVDLEHRRAKLSVATEKVNNQARAAEDATRALPSPSSNAARGGAVA